MSSVYARIDYPDEDLGDFDDSELLGSLYNIRKEIDFLRSTYKTGKAVSQGVKTVICGKPNAGKSSFYNSLLGEEAAIVTDIEGTTRDVLERSLPLGKVVLRLADTAGIRTGEKIDAVEQIGIGKSLEKIEECELLFAIFDTSRAFDNEDELIIEAIKGSSAPKIALLNKSDLVSKFDEERLSCFDRVLHISAREKEGEAVSALAELVNQLFTDERIVIGQDAIISSARQHAALTRCLDFIDAAIESLTLGFAQDAASCDIERALGAISELDGRAVSEEIVSDIFSKFCVGK
jgi:tRNA modification GTPase